MVPRHAASSTAISAARGALPTSAGDEFYRAASRGRGNAGGRGPRRSRIVDFEGPARAPRRGRHPTRSSGAGRRCSTSRAATPLRICRRQVGGRCEHAQESINELMIEHARQGRRVVRLKGGDSFASLAAAGKNSRRSGGQESVSPWCRESPRRAAVRPMPGYRSPIASTPTA